MTKPSSFRCIKPSPEVIRLAVMLYVRFLLSLRNVEGLVHERGRYQLRNSTVLVEQVWAIVCIGNPREANSESAIIFKLAVAFG